MGAKVKFNKTMYRKRIYISLAEELEIQNTK